MNSTIGIYGGAFDPPTWGHYQVAKAAIDSGKVGFVEFLPCWKHAFGKELTSFNKRVEMCKLMTDLNANMGVCTLEGVLKTTYSIDILEQLIINIKEALETEEIDFRLIMGSDNYWKMDKWKNPDRVKELAPPLWISRPGIEELPSEEWNRDDVIYLASNYSSTGLRNAIKNKGIEAPAMTKSTVLDYIMMNGLY